MRTIQQTSAAENIELGNARIGRCAGSNDPLETSKIEMTAASRSPPLPRRWVAHRKAEVVAAVRGGYLSLEEARKRYALSTEEYLTWQREIDRFGLAGLRVYRTQERRRAGSLSPDQ